MNGAGRGASVSLTDLEKKFERVNAVDGVSLDIRSGEFLTLLGPSGSGKTTTLMMIAGFEVPTAGDIAIDGTSVVAMPPYRRNIGMVFQNYALFPHLDVAGNIGYGLKVRGTAAPEIARRVAAALALVQLDGYAGRGVQQLSGGEQQRVALARALIIEPDVLLMDEPLGALDRQLRKTVQLELRRLHEAHRRTTIYVTHDQEEALVMSDRIGVMNHGKLIRVGTPRELYEDPGDPFVAEFLGETNLLTGTVQGSGRIALDGGAEEVTVLENAAPGTRVHVVVRPERVAVATNADGLGDWNRLSGRIEEIIYVGEATKYRIRTQAGRLMRVKQLNRRLETIYEVGHEVALCWHPSDCRLLEAK
jgi:spermidine/putrescine ABC transporter ATP-binding subunit